MNFYTGKENASFVTISCFHNVICRFINNRVCGHTDGQIT